MAKSFTWHVCEKCMVEIVKDCQEHERVIVRNPAYADGDCSICLNTVRYLVKVQQNTQEWLLKFTFNKEYQARIKAFTPMEKSS